MSFLKSLLPTLQLLVLPFTGALTAWLHTWLSKKPSDAERAAHIAVMAKDAAAAAANLLPTLAGKDLINQAVSILSSAAGTPTKNYSILERAVIGALTELGKLPTP